MCSPIAAVAALQLTGGAVGAKAALDQGKADYNQYRYMADQRDQAAVIAEQQGDYQSKVIQDKGLFDTNTLLANADRVSGRQKTAQAANGVGGGSVTSLDIAGDSFDRTKADELAIKFNADSASWSATTEAKNKAWQLREEARLFREAGKNARRAGKMNAVSSLLNSASSFGSTAMKFQKA